MLNIWILKRRFDYYRGVFLLGKGRLTFIRSKLMIKEEPGGGNCDEKKKNLLFIKNSARSFLEC